ncbi:hypothetical protein N7495_008456 [Penicillium taxi]|uniref:uncharacterized protein n=1 Tax=Penicillium taxi TaxID=168475 RepID=UPI002544DA87|nr:uncharacterized protein N7495_008456 [Penicillium taxi]KAJ5888415.1 hypothetical protein N7495_008456 [Penicillium taxi]
MLCFALYLSRLLDIERESELNYAIGTVLLIWLVRLFLRRDPNSAEGYITAAEKASLSKDGRSPPDGKELGRQLHAPIVSVAAKALAEKNIPIVEYGEQIQWRYGDPAVLLGGIK